MKDYHPKYEIWVNEEGQWKWSGFRLIFEDTTQRAAQRWRDRGYEVQIRERQINV